MAELKSMSYEESRAEYFKALMKKMERKIDWWQAAGRSLNRSYNSRWHNECSEAGMQYNFCKDALEALENQPKWISVKEMLPGYGAGMFFIVFRDDGEVSEARFEIYNGRWYERTTEGLWEIDVTHWMPMPMPPKENPQ